MKLNKFLCGAVFATALAFPVVANAETVTDDTAKATFELVAPDSGALSIVSADDLVFNAATITADNVVTTTSADSAITIQEISGAAPGWTLTAQLGNFTGSNSTTISGARLFYPSITPTTTKTGDTSSILPTSVNTDNAFTGTDKGVILSSGGDSVKIVGADLGKGYGEWEMNYPTSKVQLEIPAGNLASTYTATLTYTLTDTP